ncbi:MAG: TIGR02450 family Trp-rich protein [Oceanospirillaceae bacterium]
MNKFNVNKLLLSKWTAINPINKQKHFLVTELVKDESEHRVESCVLEAVINNDQFKIDWQELKNSDCWIQGWQ